MHKSKTTVEGTVVLQSGPNKSCRTTKNARESAMKSKGSKMGKLHEKFGTLFNRTERGQNGYQSSPSPTRGETGGGNMTARTGGTGVIHDEQ